jgi:hypothetical protein
MSDEKDQWLSDITLDAVFAMFSDNGATELLFKVLPRNANSKNQVYLAPDLSQLGKIPSGEVSAYESISTKSGQVEAVFRAPLEFYWLDRDGAPSLAPNAKLIFYPQYPEVRFSGFLQGCRQAPSSLYDKNRRGEEPGRILIFGVGNGAKVLAMTLPPESPAAKQIMDSGPYDEYGALWLLPFPQGDAIDGFLALMQELCALHHRSWVPATRLDPSGALISCAGTNCNGNTLESQLGIRSNGISLPDYRGWEVKARSVTNSERPGASVVTLFTPEPTGGIYVEKGFDSFVRTYGYPDTRGRADRINFGGVYSCIRPAHARTGLRMVLDGYDPGTGKPGTEKYQSTGAIRLLDESDNDALSWSFVKLMDHWKAKHAHAAFVPAQQRKQPGQQYRFGNQILIGEGAEFGRFLRAVHLGAIYYDPGIKIEDASSSRPSKKRRSQIRVKSRDIPTLYESSRIVDACSEATSQ